MRTPPFDTFTPPWCRGSYALGTACGKCDKCAWEREEMKLTDEQNGAAAPDAPAAEPAAPAAPAAPAEPAEAAAPIAAGLPGGPPAQQPIELEACPCGKPVEGLIIEMAERAKHGRALCPCGEWGIEFRNNYEADPNKTLLKASKAWNEAPRAD